MKLLYHHRTQAEDGQAVHIRSLIEAFKAERHEVCEVALVQRGNAEAPPVTAPDEKGGWDWIGRVPRFVRELAEYGYTIPARGRLLKAAREFRPDFLYERYAFGCAGGVQAAARLNIPLMLEVNSPMVLELSRTRGLSFPRFARRVENSIFRRAQRVCVVTAVLGEMLVELGVERERLVVTPNGVHPQLYANPDRTAARADLGLTEVEGSVLGFVGYYRDWHRLDLVIEGLRDAGLQKAHLVLIGNGPVEDELREKARVAGVGERVHFAGRRAHHQIPSLLPAFDVALIPAINPYASALKLHEYMAAGLPVVAPDQPNLREVLTNGDNGVLVTPGDGDALCDALRRLVQDAGLRERLGERARASIVEQELTWTGNVRRVVKALEPIR
ncbi:MAG: glycosyltransferase involved in cell wall biosynthesis [Chlamydiales bacterium]|jgi:glycosyltransferase involved in cell wall biosynthesis